MAKIFLCVLISFLEIFICNAGETGNSIEFEVEKVTSNVYTAHPRGPISRINGTSTIIVSSGFLTVIDAQPDIFLGRELIKAINKKISKLPIRYLIFTHFHIDHILGSGAFVENYPSITIIGHQKFNEYINGFGPKEKQNWEKYLSELALQKSTDASLKYQFQELRSYVADVSRSKLISPTILFSDSLTITDQDLILELKAYGGHTDSDVVVYHKQSGVIMTGDLIHDFEPLFLFDHANPEVWIKSLSEISKIEFKYVIGGHGNYQEGKEVLTQWLNYLVELRAKIMEAIESGKSLSEYKKTVTAESFESLMRNGYGDRIQNKRTSLMSTAFIGPLDDAIRGEIDYLWKYYGGKD